MALPFNATGLKTIGLRCVSDHRYRISTIYIDVLAAAQIKSIPIMYTVQCIRLECTIIRMRINRIEEQAYNLLLFTFDFEFIVHWHVRSMYKIRMRQSPVRTINQLEFLCTPWEYQKQR